MGIPFPRYRYLAPGARRRKCRHGIAAEHVNKVYEGPPHTEQAIESGVVDLVINTVGPDAKAIRDSYSMRRAALLRGIPYCTTLAAARASAGAIRGLQKGSIGVRSLQEIHARMAATDA